MNYPVPVDELIQWFYQWKFKSDYYCYGTFPGSTFDLVVQIIMTHVINTIN